MKSSLRRFIGARKKVGATVAAIVLGAGVALVAAPLSASAHTATLSVSASCTTATGAAVVTWTITNDYNEVLNVTASDNSAIPVGATVAATNGGANTTKTFTQNIAAPAAGKTASASVDFKWSGDNFEQKSTKPITTTVGPTCTIPDKQDASAAAVTTAATCTANGNVTFTLSNATWDDATDTTDGSRNATAPTGHVFANGTRYETVTYTFPSKLTNCDATATAAVTPGTCTTGGGVTFATPVNATWDDTTDLTDGSRDATAAAGHVFANGTQHETVVYTIPSKFTNCDATATVSVATAATCTAAGTVAFNLTNATWNDANDVTDGSRVATAAAGHIFADGTSTATITYTIPSQLTNCAVVPPVTPPTVTPPTVTPPVVSPPKVTPATTTTTTKVDSPTVTPEKNSSTDTVSPTLLASTGMNDSTPIAATIALFALLFGGTIVTVAARRARKARSE